MHDVELQSLASSILGSQCPFQVLGLQVGSATLADVKGAYRRLCLLCHPDKSALPTQLARECFQALQAAYAEAGKRLQPSALHAAAPTGSLWAQYYAAPTDAAPPPPAAAAAAAAAPPVRPAQPIRQSGLWGASRGGGAPSWGTRPAATAAAAVVPAPTTKATRKRADAARTRESGEQPDDACAPGSPAGAPPPQQRQGPPRRTSGAPQPRSAAAAAEVTTGPAATPVTEAQVNKRRKDARGSSQNVEQQQERCSPAAKPEPAQASGASPHPQYPQAAPGAAAWCRRPVFAPNVRLAAVRPPPTDGPGGMEGEYDEGGGDDSGERQTGRRRRGAGDREPHRRTRLRRAASVLSSDSYTADSMSSGSSSSDEDCSAEAHAGSGSGGGDSDVGSGQEASVRDNLAGPCTVGPASRMTGKHCAPVAGAGPAACHVQASGPSGRPHSSTTGVVQADCAAAASEGARLWRPARVLVPLSATAPPLTAAGYGVATASQGPAAASCGNRSALRVDSACASVSVSCLASSRELLQERRAAPVRTGGGADHAHAGAAPAAPTEPSDHIVAWHSKGVSEARAYMLQQQDLLGCARPSPHAPSGSDAIMGASRWRPEPAPSSPPQEQWHPQELVHEEEHGEEGQQQPQPEEVVEPWQSTAPTDAQRQGVGPVDEWLYGPGAAAQAAAAGPSPESAGWDPWTRGASAEQAFAAETHVSGGKGVAAPGLWADHGQNGSGGESDGGADFEEDFGGDDAAPEDDWWDEPDQDQGGGAPQDVGRSGTLEAFLQEVQRGGQLQAKRAGQARLSNLRRGFRGGRRGRGGRGRSGRQARGKASAAAAGAAVKKGLGATSGTGPSCKPGSRGGASQGMGILRFTKSVGK